MSESAADPAPTVSLVLPVHRDGPDVRRCLRAVAALDPPPAEVVVVVDGGDTAAADLAKPHATRLVNLARQGGPARARNAAVREATGDVVLFIDADVEVRPDIVAGVAGYLRDHPEVDALIGSYDDAPGAANFLSQYKNLLNHYVHQRSRTEGFTFWGACGAVRRKVFAELGGFDESYTVPSIEDIEFGYRLRDAGGRIHVVGDIQVKHLKRWDARSLLHADIVCRALPWSELILAHGGFDDDLNIDRTERAKVAITGAMLLGAAAVRRPAGRLVAGAAAAGLLALDRDLLRFYTRRRGAGFAAAAVPWVWLSYAYSGASFAVASARHLTGRSARPGRLRNRW